MGDDTEGLEGAEFFLAVVIAVWGYYLAPTKISAREVIIDIGAGLSNNEIGEKYRLSEKGIRSLLDQLLGVNLLSSEEH